MIFGRKRNITPVADDIDEARAIRQTADEEFRELKGQAPMVKSLTQSLINRRVNNHFGDALSITFMPRRD